MTAPADAEPLGESLPTSSVPLRELHPHPDNPNEGDDDAVADSLRRYGQWRPIVAQAGTGRVLIGHTMLRAAEALGWARLWVHWRDVDDDTARRIVAVDNRTRDLATYDERKLVRLLAGMDDLDGTGWRDDDLDDLRALVEEQDAAALRALARDDDDGSRPASQVRHTPTQQDHLANYDGKGTRHIALVYPNGPYVWLVDRLTQLADRYGVESTAEVVLALVAEVTGDEAPPLLDDDSETVEG